VVFIETPIFTEEVSELLADAEYAALQLHLALRPDAGDVIRGCGGLRKVRWAAMGKGKRGGVRVIYYHVAAAGQIRMLLIYRKGVQDDLTQAQRVALRHINEGWR
jgi:mRNA-degrading endonuclease RelE of RelBE toxin-antitoxin system